MKNAFALTALAAASFAVSAQQTSLQLYGLVDAGLTHVTGLAQGSVTQLNSGIMEGSRWGLRGNEDLGNGYRAVFTLESRLEVDTGASSNRAISGSQVPDRLAVAGQLGLPGALQPAVTAVAASLGAQIGVNHIQNNSFDRQAYVGLVTPFGGFLAGRQYTPAYEISAIFDTMHTESSLAVGQVASFPPSIDIRLSNSGAYRIVKGPVTASLMLAGGEGSSTATFGRFIGLMGMYKADSFSFGAGYNSRNNEGGLKSLRSFVLGASAKAGPGELITSYTAIKDDNPSGLSTIATTLTPLVGAVNAAAVQSAYVNALRQDARVFHVGYRMIFGPSTVSVAYNAFNDRRPSDADVRSYGAAYTYALSKRTDLNAVLTRFDNKGSAQAAPGGGGYLGGVTATAGTDSTSLALGVRHRF
jgi:predicted porin